MASAAQCTWQFVVFHTIVVNDVSRITDCLQKSVMRVNDLLSSNETHGRQRSARVPKGVLKLAFMEQSSPRSFGTYVWTCF